MKRTRFLPFACLLLLPLLFTGCKLVESTSGTLNYGKVQQQFSAAVQTDNAGNSGSNPAAASTYEAVSRELTNSHIAKLDPKERPNAWMLRGFSEWRSGNLKAAATSAQNGLSAGPVKHSRDMIVLTMLPALVIDAEVVKEWKGANQEFNAAQYAEAERSYFTAVQKLDAAKSEFGDATPESTKNYFYYQKSRLFNNWQTIVNHLAGGESVQDRTSQELKGHFGGRSLVQVAKEAKSSISDGSPSQALTGPNVRSGQ